MEDAAHPFEGAVPVAALADRTRALTIVPMRDDCAAAAVLGMLRRAATGAL
jgi:hypothetical protein